MYSTHLEFSFVSSPYKKFIAAVINSLNDTLMGKRVQVREKAS